MTFGYKRWAGCARGIKPGHASICIHLAKMTSRFKYLVSNQLVLDIFRAMVHEAHEIIMMAERRSTS